MVWPLLVQLPSVQCGSVVVSTNSDAAGQQQPAKARYGHGLSRDGGEQCVHREPLSASHMLSYYREVAV